MNRFADTAGRLDRLIADIKARQCGATGAGPQPAPDRQPPGQHPDQEWQRAYATRTIRSGARGESAPVPMQSVVAPPVEQPQPPEPPPGKPVRPAPATGHIGAALGKPAKKRGVLARLFRGSDR
jgi:hypothetical protein